MKTCAAVLVATIILLAPSVRAQSSPATETAPLWEVQLDVQKVLASPIGQAVLEKVKKDQPDIESKINDFSKAIGIDVRTAIGPVSIFGNSYEDPDDNHDADISAVVSLGESRGNIEGWVLAAPGYKSEKLEDGTLLHSFAMDKDEPRVWCALQQRKSDGRYLLVASLRRENAIRLAKEGFAGLSSQLEGDSLLKVRVSGLSAAPLQLDDDQPGAGLVRVVQSIVVDVGDSADQLNAHVTIEADSPTSAEQIQQLMTGLKAMLALAAPQDDANAQKALEFMNRLTLQYQPGDTKVNIEFTVDNDTLTEFLHENM